MRIVGSRIPRGMLTAQLNLKFTEHSSKWFGCEGQRKRARPNLGKPQLNDMEENSFLS